MAVAMAVATVAATVAAITGGEDEAPIIKRRQQNQEVLSHPYGIELRRQDQK
jgi:hypothetical protein